MLLSYSVPRSLQTFYNGPLKFFESLPQLKYVSGNLQNSPSGQNLKEPFIVKLLDKYENPIYDHPVIFKVKVGKGYFPGNKRTYVTRTDRDGIAQSYFTLRPDPGFNSIIAYAKGLKRSRIQFEALGQ